jgi:hypothetical protein
MKAHVHKSSNDLAIALSSLHIDTTMVRQPPNSGMKWELYSKWPRVEDGEEKGKRKRKSQSDWQADTKWKWKMVALTMPKLNPPVIK